MHRIQNGGQPPLALYLRTGSSTPPPPTPLQNIITHQLLHLNSTDEDTNKTDGMFLCMTQNGEMYTIGTAPRFFRRIVEFGHDLEQRQHVDEFFNTCKSGDHQIYLKETFESVKDGQNDISYIACFQFTRTARCSQCFGYVTL